jgi:hypothetical protein
MLTNKEAFWRKRNLVCLTEILQDAIEIGNLASRVFKEGPKCCRRRVARTTCNKSGASAFHIMLQTGTKIVLSSIAAARRSNLGSHYNRINGIGSSLLKSCYLVFKLLVL